RARALLLLGEREDAQREVDEALRRVGRSGAELRRVAGWALARGFPESAFRIATPLLAGGADPQLARLAYPAAFPDHVVAEARENRLRPELLWAIMRQESRFDPAVRSPAGALGLLQLMPATARREAARARAASFDLADLSRPEPNLHLGAMHLRALLEGLNGEWVAAIAAYNAGSTLARRWSSFPESVTAEGFVERIPFRETRNYVKLILANHAWYADLYSAG
ncbi:MAG: lytic transglycosylase domain-containing protein, partial [Gemmatimonadota bacterium]